MPWPPLSILFASFNLWSSCSKYLAQWTLTLGSDSRWSPWGCVFRSCSAFVGAASTQLCVSCLCGDHLPHPLSIIHHRGSHLAVAVDSGRWLLSDSLYPWRRQRMLWQPSRAMGLHSPQIPLTLLPSPVHSNITLLSVLPFPPTDTSLLSSFWFVLSLQYLSPLFLCLQPSNLLVISQLMVMEKRMSEGSTGVGRKTKDAPYPYRHQGSDRNGEAPGN